MLKHLLELLARGSVYRVEDLARELDTSRDMTEHMLNDLVRMGYLREVAMSCERGCEECAFAGACAVSANQRIWALTEKGRAQLRERSTELT